MARPELRRDGIFRSVQARRFALTTIDYLSEKAERRNYYGVIHDCNISDSPFYSGEHNISFMFILIADAYLPHGFDHFCYSFDIHLRCYLVI